MGVKIPLTEKDVATIEAMSGWGMTMQQIAQVLKMNKRTLERRIKDTPAELGAAVALERGRAVAASVVARKCYEMASSGKEPGMTQFWLQCRADWKKTEANPQQANNPEVKVVIELPYNGRKNVE